MLIVGNYHLLSDAGIAKWMAKKWTDASIPYLNRKRSQCVFLLGGKI